jgi:hypothetical protein
MCPLSEQQLFWYRRLLLRDLTLMGPGENGEKQPEAAETVTGIDGTQVTGVRNRPRTAEEWKRLRNLLMQLRKVRGLED